MGEMKGFLFSIIFFIAFMFPALLMLSIDSLQSHAFMKVTTEMHELVKEEGGVGTKTDQLLNQLEAKGYNISFKDEHGNPINGVVEYGNTVNMDYVYTYESIMGERELKTSNSVFIMKRNNP